MSAPTTAAGSDRDSDWARLGAPVLPALLLGLVLLGVAFHAEAAAAYRVWMESTAYSHCFFVLPIAAYMAWDRRRMLADVPVVPAPAMALLALPLGAVWLAAERMGIMEGRQLVAVAILEVLFLTVLGWRMFRALMAPLLYLFFLVPSGAFLTGPLQDFTAAFINVGLDLLRIPHYSDAYIIEIPAGRFYVAEACAGLRFLIASIAFGVLYAVLMYRSTGRRVAFMVASVIVPIIANGFRALGIVVLGQILGSAEAAAADHIVYGWLFFSVVILLLIMAGLPFRQEAAPAPAPSASVLPVAGPSWRPLLAAFVVGVIASIGPAIAAGLDSAAATALAAPEPRLAIPPDCRLAGSVQTQEAGRWEQHYACARGSLSVLAMVFPPRVNPARIVTARRSITGELRAEEAIFSAIDVPGVSPVRWPVVTTYNPAAIVATSLWVNGAPAQGGLAGRLALARGSVLGTAHAPVLMAVGVVTTHRALTMEEDREARRLIARFLAAQTALPAEIDRLSREAAGSR